MKGMSGIMRKLFIVLCLGTTPSTVQPAQAQVVLDLSKVTCEQWSGYKITKPQNIALWLSGYYNGKRRKTVRAPGECRAHTQMLRDSGSRTPQWRLMQAVEKPVGK